MTATPRAYESPADVLLWNPRNNGSPSAGSWAGRGRLRDGVRLDFPEQRSRELSVESMFDICGHATPKAIPGCGDVARRLACSTAGRSSVETLMSTSVRWSRA